MPAARRIIQRIAPTAAIENVKTVTQIRDESISPRRLNAALVSAFGILAVFIAAVGIAGVLAFSVSTLMNEIGIRMSLGADASRVQRMILREGGVLLVTALALGMAGGTFAARAIRGLLFGIAPHDPTTFMGVVLTMAAIGVGACWIPAVRAARIEPADHHASANLDAASAVMASAPYSFPSALPGRVCGSTRPSGSHAKSGMTPAIFETRAGLSRLRRYVVRTHS